MEIASLLLGLIIGFISAFYLIYKNEIDALIFVGKQAKQAKGKGFDFEKIVEMGAKFMNGSSSSGKKEKKSSPVKIAKKSDDDDDGPPPLERSKKSDDDEDDPLDHIDTNAVRAAPPPVEEEKKNPSPSGNQDIMAFLAKAVQGLAKNPAIADAISNFGSAVAEQTPKAPVPETPVE